MSEHRPHLGLSTEIRLAIWVYIAERASALLWWAITRSERIDPDLWRRAARPPGIRVSALPPALNPRLTELKSTPGTPTQDCAGVHPIRPGT